MAVVNADRGTIRRMSDPVAGDMEEREILLEFVELDGCVRVAALDAATGIEIALVGPASAGVEALSRAAIDKLRYVLLRHTKPARPRRPGIYV